MKEQECEICGGYTEVQKLCHCGEIVCGDCAKHILSGAVNPKCPGCNSLLKQ